MPISFRLVVNHRLFLDSIIAFAINNINNEKGKIKRRQSEDSNR